MRPSYAFILTHNRHELLRGAVDAICGQVNAIAIIDNASFPPVTWNHVPPCVHTIITDPLQPPNLAALMNTGFEWAAKQAQDWSQHEWDVAVICDDVHVPPGWFNAVANCVRATGAAAGSTHQTTPVSEPLLKMAGDGDLWNRMQGSACVFRGELGLRADEEMHWWWQDTDLDWQARYNGGMVIAPGPVAHNIHPNDFTYSVPGLSEQAGRDGEVFARKWGYRPW